MTPEERDRLTNHPDPRADHEEAAAKLQAAMAAAGERLHDAIDRVYLTTSAVDFVRAVRAALAAYRAEVGPAADAEAAAAERAGR